MLINEASIRTDLTKKAIEYYIEHGLIFPTVLENGYRDFDDDDIEILLKVSVLRKIGISTSDIRLILDDKKNEVLRDLSVTYEIKLQKELAKKVLLDKLSQGARYSEISAQLGALEKHTSITEKLLDSFPGYYGRFICLHFAGFLNEAIITEKQEKAYEKIMLFLDNLSPLEFSDELRDYLDESTTNITVDTMNEMMENTQKTLDNVDDFLIDNKEMLAQYLDYKQSDEYLNSPAYQMMSLIKEFNETSGYYDIFIPALQDLSPYYATYYMNMQKANDELLSKYPEIEKLQES